jgi:hypothetical protein
MGGFLRPPKPPKSSVSTPAAVAQPTIPVPPTDAVQQQAREEALARLRRGLVGTIATSPRGLLTQTDDLPFRKSLLGE